MLDSVTGERPSAGSFENALDDLAGSVVGPALVRWLWAATLAAVLGDLVTTLYGLHIGLAERNPVVVWVLAEFGVAGMVAMKVVAVGWVVAIWWALGRTYGLAALAGLFLPQALAVCLNVLTLLAA